VVLLVGTFLVIIVDLHGKKKKKKRKKGGESNHDTLRGCSFSLGFLSFSAGKSANKLPLELKYYMLPMPIKYCSG
jgi:hypothetical protein